jgi:hypothetical protein
MIYCLRKECKEKNPMRNKSKSQALQLPMALLSSPVENTRRGLLLIFSQKHIDKKYFDTIIQPIMAILNSKNPQSAAIDFTTPAAKANSVEKANANLPGQGHAFGHASRLRKEAMAEFSLEVQETILRLELAKKHRLAVIPNREYD